MRYTTLVVASFLFATTALCQQREISTKQIIAQPYPSINGSFSKEEIKESPDPLASYRWENPSQHHDLQTYTIFPLSVTTDCSNAAKWDNDKITTIDIHSACNIRFDFGQVNAGWMEFDCYNLPKDAEMSISEFNEPAVFNAGSQHPRKTARPIRYGNSYRLELNDDLYEGVRYGWIHIRNLDKPIKIENVRLVCQIRPTNYEGSFWCDDNTLTRIWYSGAYTVKLNLLKEYFGAILMERSDRHSWTGDAHPSQAASMVAFGNFDFVKTNLYYTSTQFNGIASYSLYWVLSLIDYFNYTGDCATLKDLAQNAMDKLDIAYNHYGKNPSLDFFGWDERLGGGFENPSCQESQMTYKMLSIRAWQEAANAFAAIGDSAAHKKYSQYAQEKMSHLRKEGEWYKDFGLFAASDAINTSLTLPQEKEAIWNTAFNDRLQRVSYSPFNQYFVMQAMAKMNRYDGAFTTIDDCWGGQLRYGGTTFFEVFRPSWIKEGEPINMAPVNNQCGYTSLTHPWSGGITKWLSEEVLGIKPLKPGFEEFEVKPHLGTKLTQVKGSVPTPKGTISFALDTKKGEGKIFIPKGSLATIAIPKLGQTIEKVDFCSGNAKKQKEDSEFLYFRLSKEGDHSFTINYKGDRTSVAIQEPLKYRYEDCASFDTSTQGDWKGKYGSKGYILCNSKGIGKSETKEADFLHPIKYNKIKDIIFKRDKRDQRTLVTSNNSRSHGAFATDDPSPCMQTFTIDLPLKKEGTKYQVALYFMDWDCNGRRSAIEIFDLNNKKILAPVVMTGEYKEGKYVVLTLDQSVRLRVDHVRGDNVGLCGIFFD